LDFDKAWCDRLVILKRGNQVNALGQIKELEALEINLVKRTLAFGFFPHPSSPELGHEVAPSEPPRKKEGGE
jgi:hypothetical protein